MKKQFYRVKQLADQTFSRSGKSETLTDELQAADRKVEQLRNALQLVGKRLTTGSGGTQGQDPAAREKRLKKLPEYMLGLSMCEASNFDDDDSILKYILYECGKTEKYLANEIAEHELKVEQLVCAPLNVIGEQDLPAIMKAKKHLGRLMSEKESAASRYHHLLRQIEQNPSKLSAAREELEEAGARVESARDSLAADMFALVAKEAQLAHTLLQYVKLQRAYHESALHSLTDIVPELERFINDSAVKPVFGFPLEEHLRVNGRTIAFPLELCVCTLYELGLNEEGLFRIAGGSSKVKRMKLSLDAGVFSVPLPAEYRDVHVVASVLKSYLRELPEPMLTYRLYDTFIAASKHSTEEARLNALWEAIHRLPEANLNNLKYLVKFLSALTQNQVTNKMTPSNLAIVIAPNLLWASDESNFSMNITTAINCVVELLIKHADWFFQGDVTFFMSFTKEDLLPDHCEYGFSPSFIQAQSAALGQENSNGEYNSLSKSMYDYSSQSHKASETTGKHSRSNSHDTSLILLDNDIKKAQSNSSLSDQSSPPQGSPKPVIRRKNKPLAPAPPPNATPDRNRKVEIITDTKEKEVPIKTESEKNIKIDTDKPSKPPRPGVSDTGKIISGVQTINRSTYRQHKALKDEVMAKTASRESLNEIRRQSLEIDREKFDALKLADNKEKDSTLVVKNITAQTGVVGRMKVLGDSFAAGITVSDNKLTKVTKPTGQPPPRPVAAPRTVIPAVPVTSIPPEPETVEVQLRHKPAVPERPATLRPQSFKISHNRTSMSDTEIVPTVLERTHVYNVEKQLPQIIQVGANQEKVEEKDDTNKGTVQRTHSSGEKDNERDEVKSLSSQNKKLSQSEGSIAESPKSPTALSPNTVLTSDSTTISGPASLTNESTTVTGDSTLGSVPSTVSQSSIVVTTTASIPVPVSSAPTVSSGRPPRPQIPAPPPPTMSESTNL